MNCCDEYGQCQNGPGCPTGAITVAPRTCEALGICQHPDRECPGACELPPKMYGVLRAEPGEPTAPFALIEPWGLDRRALQVLGVLTLVGALAGIGWVAGPLLARFA